MRGCGWGGGGNDFPLPRLARMLTARRAMFAESVSILIDFAPPSNPNLHSTRHAQLEHLPQLPNLSLITSSGCVQFFLKQTHDGKSEADRRGANDGDFRGIPCL